MGDDSQNFIDREIGACKMENTIPFILKDAFDEDFDQRRRKAGEEAGGQEAGPAHCFWDALISVRSFNHPESHGKPPMAFLF
jgi:hypothetical protein